MNVALYQSNNNINNIEDKNKNVIDKSETEIDVEFNYKTSSYEQSSSKRPQSKDTVFCPSPINPEITHQEISQNTNDKENLGNYSMINC